MRRSDLQGLADRKVSAALALSELRYWSNSYYLAGYSIEMALKACISRQISTDTIPDKNLIIKTYTHNINELVGLAGLKAEQQARIAKDTLFAANWAICSEWSPEARYQEKSHAEAHYLLVAITDANNGVLPWIKNYW